MAGESDKNVFLIQRDASIFAEIEISEFDISRVDCTFHTFISKHNFLQERCCFIPNCQCINKVMHVLLMTSFNHAFLGAECKQSERQHIPAHLVDLTEKHADSHYGITSR